MKKIAAGGGGGGGTGGGAGRAEVRRWRTPNATWNGGEEKRNHGKESKKKKKKKITKKAPIFLSLLFRSGMGSAIDGKNGDKKRAGTRALFALQTSARDPLRPRLDPNESQCGHGRPSIGREKLG